MKKGLPELFIRARSFVADSSSESTTKQIHHTAGLNFRQPEGRYVASHRAVPEGRYVASHRAVHEVSGIPAVNKSGLLGVSRKDSLTTAALVFAIGCLAGLPTSAEALNKSVPDKTAKKPETAQEKPAPKTPEPVIENLQTVTPEQVVDHPHDYLNKNIKFLANFHSFTNVGLDYKPALRSSKTHLSFFVLRQGSKIPLSEMKLDMPIPKEKDPENQMLISLKDGDQIEVIGKVFSTALDDPWVDVIKLKKLPGLGDDKKNALTKTDKDNNKEALESPPDVENRSKGQGSVGKPDKPEPNSPIELKSPGTDGKPDHSEK